MSDKYKIFEGDEAYFVTFTVIEWIKILENDSLLSLLFHKIKINIAIRSMLPAAARTFLTEGNPFALAGARLPTRVGNICLCTIILIILNLYFRQIQNI